MWDLEMGLHQMVYPLPIVRLNYQVVLPFKNRLSTGIGSFTNYNHTIVWNILVVHLHIRATIDGRALRYDVREPLNNFLGM